MLLMLRLYVAICLYWPIRKSLNWLVYVSLNFYVLCTFSFFTFFFYIQVNFSIFSVDFIDRNIEWICLIKILFLCWKDAFFFSSCTLLQFSLMPMLFSKKKKSFLKKITVKINANLLISYCISKWFFFPWWYVFILKFTQFQTKLYKFIA